MVSIWITKNPDLLSRLAAIKQGRLDRNEAMCQRFRADGIDMTMEKLQHGNPDTVVTRAHFARVLIAEGVCRDMNQAFKKYLGKRANITSLLPTFRQRTP